MGSFDIDKWERHFPTIPKKKWKELLNLRSAIAATKDFSKPILDENGAINILHCDYSQVVWDFMGLCNEMGLVVDFNWGAWKEEGRRYLETREVAQADLITLIKLITTHIRRDRFCTGHMAGVFENGHITAILNRLAQLLEID